MPSSKQLLAIKRGEFQLGIVRLFEENLPEFVITPLSEERYLFALPSDHRLTKKQCVTIHDLVEEPMIFTPKDENPRLWVAWHKTFAEAGLSPNIVQETYSKHTSVALVSAGIGLTFVPESTTKIKPKGIVFKEIQGSMPILKFSMLHLKDRPNPIINNFLSIANRIKEVNQSL